MTSLLKKVKSKMFIASYRKAMNALEGEYVSLMKGRSMDFDDLREYVAGDNVKDIDWKASARHSSPLVKQYIANRKQPVYFVVDAGLNMQALSEELEEKKNLVLDIVGILGYLTVKHSDMVGLTIGDNSQTVFIPPRETESHLERLLKVTSKTISESEHPGNIYKQLQHVVDTAKSKGLVVVVADEVELNASFDSLLRKLKSMHEVLWVSIPDGNPFALTATSGMDIRDIETDNIIPEYLRNLTSVKNSVAQLETIRQDSIKKYLTKMNISHASLSSSQKSVPVLLGLLERRLRERRR